MTIFYKQPDAEINADLTWYASDGLTTSELRALERLDAADLVAYADAVPSYDYMDPGMWDYIAYWYDLPTPAETEDWDPEAFLAAAKAAEAARQ